MSRTAWVEPAYFPIVARGKYKSTVHGSRWLGPEGQVVRGVIEELIDMGYPGELIHPEYTLGPGCRVDVAVIGSVCVLLFECKGVRILPRDVRQADRYLAAARRRWPDRAVKAYLIAPAIDPKVVERDDLEAIPLRPYRVIQ